MSNDTNPAPHQIAEKDLEVFADDFQFSLADGRVYLREPTRQWIEDLMPPQLLAATEGVLSVGTVRNMDVPVTVQIWDADPGIDATAWEQIVEASLWMSITPGTYRARLSYPGLDTLSPNGLEGDDHYRIALWPGRYQAITITKQHT